MTQLGTVIRYAPGRCLRLVLGLMAISGQAAAQDDSTALGPPPHFAASWAPAGSLIDVSHMGVLRQRLSVDLTDVPLRDALREIRERGKIELAYDLEALPIDHVVSLHAKGLTVASALGEVLLDTGLDVFMTRNGQLALLACPHVLRQGDGQGGVIAGRVTNRATGAPLAGATVLVDESGVTTAVNTDGRYRLVGLTSGAHTVTARHIGFAPVTVTVETGPNLVVQNFALPASVQQLEQVVVTGTVTPTEMKAVPTPVTVITADEIQRRNVQRIDQLFRGETPGAFAWDPTTLDHFTPIMSRGASSLDNSFVKVFIDGIETADPGFISTIDLNSIERVELIRGPQASTIYGSDAIGGVLQIFVKKGKFGLSRPEGDVKISVGAIEKTEGKGFAPRHEEAVSLRGGDRHTSFNLAGNYRYEGEWTPSYENFNWGVTLGAENVAGPLTSRLSAHYGRKVFDSYWLTALRDAGYTYYSKPPFEVNETRSQTYGVNLHYTAKPWWSHDLMLGYDRFTFELNQTQPRFTTPEDSLLGAVASSGEKASVFYSTTVNVRPNRFVGVVLTTGFNHYMANLSQVVVSGATKLTGTLDGITSTFRRPYTNSGLFAQTQIDVADAVFLTGGIRAEQNTNLGPDAGVPVSPRTGITYVRPVGSAVTKLRLSYGESIRPPASFQGLAIVQGQQEQLANPALGPERQHGVDAGVDVYWGSRASLSATYYDQRAIDLVVQVYDTTPGSALQRYQYQNVGRIKNSGWEFEGRVSLRRLQLSGAYTTQNSTVQQLSLGYRGPYQVGDRVQRVPRSIASLTAEYSPLPRMVVRGTMSHVGDWMGRDVLAIFATIFGGAPPRASERDYWIAYPAFTRFNLAVEQGIREGVSAVFQVNNLTNDRSFESENNFVPPSRTLTIGFRAAY